VTELKGAVAKKKEKSNKQKHGHFVFLLRKKA
jgi:hypothetical protein